jgi:choline-phosphate cytidylyltransferase/glycerol-3-phosphate cytidylyltransferase
MKTVITNVLQRVAALGNDWEGKFDHLKSLCEVVYLKRTPSVSTTEIIEVITSTR